MKLVAYFTDTERRLLRWAGGRLAPEASFTADEAGLRSWRECLVRRRGSQLTLVLDLAGEEFHEEELPRLRGGDRAALMERRLAQRFGGARLAAAWPLHKRNGDRVRERVVLATPGNASGLAPWLEAIRAGGVRLCGAHSSASLAPALLHRCTGKVAHGIVLAVLAHRLRECWMESGRLRLARLVAMDALSAPALARQMRDEAGRLVEYLTTLQGTSVRERLTVLVLASGALRECVQQAFGADARFDLRFVAVEQAAQQIGLREAAAAGGAEPLFLAMAAGRPPPEQFAQREERRMFLHWRKRRVWLALGAACFAAGSAYAGTRWLEARTLRDQAAETRRETRAAMQRAAGTAASPSSLPDLATLRSLSQEVRRIAASTAAPEPALAHLSRALGASPGIELEALAWSAAPRGMPAQAAGSVVQTLEITARVRAAESGTRAMATEIARFTAELASGPGWQIVRTRLPFDLTPQGTLKGGDGMESPGQRFVVVIASSPA